MNHIKRFAAALLALALLLCALPLAAFAAEGDPYMEPIPNSSYQRPDGTINKITSDITLDGVLEAAWKKEATAIPFNQDALKKSGLLWSATTDGILYESFTSDGNGTAYVGWNEDYFLFALEIKDAKNTNNCTKNADLWQGDCLQMQIGSDAKNFPTGNDEDASLTKVQRYEFGFALSSTTNRGLGYRWLPTGLDLPAARKQNVKELSGDVGYFVATANGTTTYEVALKPSAFGKNGKLAKGDIIPFSFSLHLFKENPLTGGTIGESGDTGWLMEWARGTVGGETPSTDANPADYYRGVKNLGSAARLTLGDGNAPDIDNPAELPIAFSTNVTDMTADGNFYMPVDYTMNKNVNAIKVRITFDPAVMTINLPERDDPEYYDELENLIRIRCDDKSIPMFMPNANKTHKGELVILAETPRHSFDKTGTFLNLPFHLAEGADPADAKIRMAVEELLDADDQTARHDFILDECGVLTFDVAAQLTIPEPEPSVAFGDVNGDGVIDTGDALLVLQYAAGLIADYDETLNMDAADVNQDGHVDVFDSYLIWPLATTPIDRFPVSIGFTVDQHDTPAFSVPNVTVPIEAQSATMSMTYAGEKPAVCGKIILDFPVDRMELTPESIQAITQKLGGLAVVNNEILDGELAIAFMTNTPLTSLDLSFILHDSLVTWTNMIRVTTEDFRYADGTRYIAPSAYSQLTFSPLVDGDFQYVPTEDGNARIVGYTGQGGDVTLPDTLGGKPVTEIDPQAFAFITSLKSVALPKTVTNILYGTFAGCTSLVSVSMPDNMVSIGDYAFADCTSLTSIDIPKNVTEIVYCAFSNCSSLAAVSIPDSVVSIDAHAFDGCNALTIWGNDGSYAQKFATENHIPFEILRKLDKVASDIAAVEGVDGVQFDPLTQLTVEEVKNDNALLILGNNYTAAKVLDITLKKDGVEVQPSGKVKVSLDVPEGFDGSTCRVFRMESDGKLTDMKAAFTDGKLAFTTEHFSQYVIAQSSAVLGDVNGDNKPDTGDALLVLQYAAKIIDGSMLNMATADVNGDGKVDTGDALLMLQYAAKLIDRFPVAE